MNPKLPEGISPDEALAFEHVRKLKRFYHHLIRYLLVLGVLTAVNLYQVHILQHTRAGYWVLWVAFGWGIGILSHAASVFDLIPFFGADWEKRQVEKRLGRPL